MPFIFLILKQVQYNTTIDRILKANLSWSPTGAKFCQLIPNLSVVSAYLILT